MDRIDNIKKEQKKHLSYNLQMLRQRTGLSVRDFCDNTFLSHASYTRYINLEDNNTPSPTVIKDFCDYFLITPQQLLNEDLPDNFIELHPDLYFSIFTNENIDEKIIDLLEHHFDFKIVDIIKAFAKLEIKIDFLPKEELASRFYTTEIDNSYKHAYTVENLVKTIHHSNKSTQVKIAKNYIDYYKNTYTQKYLLAKEIQKTKSIPSIIVRFRTLQPPTDIDPDIYKTVKTMSLNQFFKYCKNYQKQILDTFHINIPH